MPSKAKQQCSYPGCTALVSGRRCEAHKPKPFHKANGERHQYDRPSPSARGYGTDWVKTRRQYLVMNPLCEDCSRLYERIEPATEVHHIKRKATGGGDEWDNLMSLCKRCHSKRTMRGE